MKKNFSVILVFVFSIVSLSCATQGKRNPQSESGVILEMTAYDTKSPFVNSVDLRSGLWFEPRSVKLKGCVLYLEGLADSILNHRPLFEKLTAAGYRVIAFDYMGQGGSQGSMNHTRLYEPLYPRLEISQQAKAIWNKYSKFKGENGMDCSESKKMIIGWSTGGLAAYKLAHEDWADAVVLFAPGIHTKIFVGEAANSYALMFTLDQVITERTLTRNKYEGQVNPHVDPIKPITPSIVPLFAKNLMMTSELSHFWSIPRRVQGLAFLSGKEDTYVNRESTKSTLEKKAPHFLMSSYDGALHEVDNEIPEVANDVHLKTIQFFDRVSAGP